MSVFVLKLLAVASMVTDHTAYFLLRRELAPYELYSLMRAVGRMAFPVFCFLIVNGFEKTSDRRGYLARLTLFAVISQVFFSLVFTDQNYYLDGSGAFSLVLAGRPLPLALLVFGVCALWYFRVRRDYTVLYPALALVMGKLRLQVWGVFLLSARLNVFYTLALGLAAMCVISRVLEGGGRWYVPVLAAAAVAAVTLSYGESVDYGYMGLALLLLLYFARRVPVLPAAVICLWSGWEYLWLQGRVDYALGAASAAALALLYNGRLGRGLKWGFYAVYPAHLGILAILNLAIQAVNMK